MSLPFPENRTSPEPKSFLIREGDGEGVRVGVVRGSYKKEVKRKTILNVPRNTLPKRLINKIFLINTQFIKI